MNGHKLILGELLDFITGETLKDTHDERYRQKVARLLVNRKGYLKADRVCMVVKYGPGSLVTRRRAVLAVSRLIAPVQIPVAVITNGKDAEIMKGASGEIIAQGLDSIPAKPDLKKIAAREAFMTISDEQAEMESRILYCYEVDDSCECDDDICRL